MAEKAVSPRRIILYFISCILLFSISIPLCFADENEELFRSSQNANQLIEARKFNEAKEAIEKMKIEYADQENLPEFLYWNAVKYKSYDKFEEAKGIYQYIVQKFPDNQWAEKSRFSIVRADVMIAFLAQDYNTANSLIDKMTINFADNSEFPEALCRITERFERIEKFDRAKALYQKICDDFPDNPWAARASFAKARTEINQQIVLKNYTEAKQLLDKFVSDFASNPDMPESIFWIAARFQNNDRFEEAKQGYKIILQNWPNSQTAKKTGLKFSEVNIFSAISRKDFIAAKAATDNFLADFPKNPDLPQTLFWIAERYQRANKFENAAAIWQQIIKNYPDKPWAEKSKFWLSRINCLSLIVSQNYEGAKIALDKFTADFSKNPDLPGALFWLAERYQRFDRFDDAKQIYQQIIDKFPNSPWADKSKIWLSRINILSLVVAQDYDNAKIALDKFTADFANNPDLPEALYWIAERYERQGKTEDAQALCQKIITDYPASSYATRAKAGHPTGSDVVQDAPVLIAAAADNPPAQAPDSNQTGNDANAASTALAVSVTSEQQNAAIELYRKARGYEDTNQLALAGQTYEKVIREYPGTIKANNAVLDIPRIAILEKMETGEVNEAGILLDKFIADFKQDPKVHDAIYQIGGEYYIRAFNLDKNGFSEQAKEYYRKALTVWEKILTQLPYSPVYTPQSYYAAANCYSDISDYNTAVNYHKKVIADYPGFENRYMAMFMLADCYNKQAAAGQISQEGAKELIFNIYRELITQYPDCSVANIVQTQLLRLDKELP